MKYLLGNAIPFAAHLNEKDSITEPLFGYPQQNVPLNIFFCEPNLSQFISFMIHSPSFIVRLVVKENKQLSYIIVCFYRPMN